MFARTLWPCAHRLSNCSCVTHKVAHVNQRPPKIDEWSCVGGPLCDPLVASGWKWVCHKQLIIFSVNHLIFVEQTTEPPRATNKHQWGVYNGPAADSLAQIPFPASILLCPRGTSRDKRGKLMLGFLWRDSKKTTEIVCVFFFFLQL